MALWDQVTRAMALAPWQHNQVITRSESDSTLSDILSRMGKRSRPWTAASTGDALAVPAVFRAVTLISNVVGALSMRSYRNGVELIDPDRPRLTVRPNPVTIPREFYRESAYSMARYGEAWWWVAGRDTDNSAASLIPLNPREVLVADNPANPLFPLIDWRGRRMLNSDMIQIKMSGDVGSLRGEGPLQRCGAAVSVAVEAQEWAANFYATGGATALWVKAALGATDEDIATFKAQWFETPNGELRVTDADTVEDIKDVAPNVAAAQMLEARGFQVGEVVRMYGLPGGFLEYAVSGSSLTYQNVGQQFQELFDVCLGPDYMEPIEQSMSDLLTRSTTARFSRDLTRGDIQTILGAVTPAFEKGLLSKDQALAIIGLAPSIENAPVPFSPPAAFPADLPALVRSAGSEIRCTCGKLLAELAAAPYRFTCPRCKTIAAAA